MRLADKTRITWTLLLILALTACASDGETEPDDLPEPVCLSGSDDPAPDFVGPSQEEALELADEQDLQGGGSGR